MSAEKTAVITGSTRGIGRGMAENFLRRGWNVVVNGRDPVSVSQAVAALNESKTAAGRCGGLAGDVTLAEDMQALFDESLTRFGAVDIWVNNAGIGHPDLPVWELKEELVRRVIEINLTGLAVTSSVVVRAMLKQGRGHIYNMEGFGSNGRIRPGISVYGASKRALRFLSRSMSAELEGSPVKLSRISPGMVATEFITGQYRDNPEDFEKARKIFNILGDRVETVTPWLVDRMISNDKNDALFEWLNTRKILWRFATARFIKRDIFS